MLEVNNPIFAVAGVWGSNTESVDAWINVFYDLYLVWKSQEEKKERISVSESDSRFIGDLLCSSIPWGRRLIQTLLEGNVVINFPVLRCQSQILKRVRLEPMETRECTTTLLTREAWTLALNHLMCYIIFKPIVVVSLNSFVVRKRKGGYRKGNQSRSPETLMEARADTFIKCFGPRTVEYVEEYFVIKRNKDKSLAKGGTVFNFMLQPSWLEKLKLKKYGRRKEGLNDKSCLFKNWELIAEHSEAFPLESAHYLVEWIYFACLLNQKVLALRATLEKERQISQQHIQNQKKRIRSLLTTVKELTHELSMSTEAFRVLYEKLKSLSLKYHSPGPSSPIQSVSSQMQAHSPIPWRFEGLLRCEGHFDTIKPSCLSCSNRNKVGESTFNNECHSTVETKAEHDVEAYMDLYLGESSLDSSLMGPVSNDFHRMILPSQNMPEKTLVNYKLGSLASTDERTDAEPIVPTVSREGIQKDCLKNFFKAAESTQHNTMLTERQTIMKPTNTLLHAALDRPSRLAGSVSSAILPSHQHESLHDKISEKFLNETPNEIPVVINRHSQDFYKQMSSGEQPTIYSLHSQPCSESDTSWSSATMCGTTSDFSHFWNDGSKTLRNSRVILDDYENQMEQLSERSGLKLKKHLHETPKTIKPSLTKTCVSSPLLQHDIKNKKSPFGLSFESSLNEMCSATTSSNSGCTCNVARLHKNNLRFSTLFSELLDKDSTHDNLVSSSSKSFSHEKEYPSLLHKYSPYCFMSTIETFLWDKYWISQIHDMDWFFQRRANVARIQIQPKQLCLPLGKYDRDRVVILAPYLDTLYCGYRLKKKLHEAIVKNILMALPPVDPRLTLDIRGWIQIATERILCFAYPNNGHQVDFCITLDSAIEYAFTSSERLCKLDMKQLGYSNFSGFLKELFSTKSYTETQLFQWLKGQPVSEKQDTLVVTGQRLLRTCMITKEVLINSIEYLCHSMGDFCKTTVILCCGIGYLERNQLCDMFPEEINWRSSLLEMDSVSNLTRMTNLPGEQDSTRDWVNSIFLLPSDFLSFKENSPNALVLKLIPLSRFLHLSELMKKNTEINIFLDAGGVGTELFSLTHPCSTSPVGHPAERELLKEMTALDGKSLEASYTADSGGTINVKLCRSPNLLVHKNQNMDLSGRSSTSYRGYRELDLICFISHIKRSCPALNLEIQPN